MQVLYNMKSCESIGEILGTFVFVYIALTQTEPLTIAVGLFVGIMIAVSFGSKAYLNPGIAIGDYSRNEVLKQEGTNGTDAMSYIGSELLGVVLAVIVVYVQNQTCGKQGEN